MAFWTNQKNIVVKKHSFKEQFSLKERTQKAKSLKVKQTDQIFVPVVVQGFRIFGNEQKPFMMLALDKTMTIVLLIEYLRRMLKLKGNQSIFIEGGGKIIHMSNSLHSLHLKNAEEDGFLYLTLKTEDTS